MILVTGASGFVGSAVLRCFVAAGHGVRALVRRRSDRRNLDGVAAELVEGDLMDRASLDRAVKGCAGVCHVAADYRLWARDPRPIFQANVEGTCNLMRAAGEAGVRRIVYTSSVAVLGILPGGTPADEQTPVAFADMIGPYKQSKFLAEAEVQRLIRDHGLPAVIVNPSTPIGPRDVRPTPTGRVVVEAAAGRMPAYVNTGLNIVHVDDVAAGHRLAFERGRVGERYVLGGENISLRDILAEIAALTGRRPPWVRLPAGLVLPLGYVAEAWARLFYPDGKEPMLTVDGVRMARKKMFFSSGKARRDLGYASRPAREALRDAVEWFRRHDYLK